MAAFIDEVINIPHINTFVLYASTENVAFGCGHSQLLPQTLKIWLMKNDSCNPCFSTLVTMQQVSLSLLRSNISSLHFLFGFDPLAPVSWLLAEHSLVDSLENILFLNLSRVAPVAWMLVRLLSSAFSRLNQRSPTS